MNKPVFSAGTSCSPVKGLFKPVTRSAAEEERHGQTGRVFTRKYKVKCSFVGHHPVITGGQFAGETEMEKFSGLGLIE